MPCNLNHRRLAAQAAAGGGGGGRRAARVQHDRGLRQPDPGDARDARVARLARGHRGLDRADGPRARLRRTRLHRRLRQDGARGADGARPRRPAGRRPVRWADARGPPRRPRSDDPGRLGGRGRARARADLAHRARRDRARGLPRRRLLRRELHGEHDGDRRRPAGPGRDRRRPDPGGGRRGEGRRRDARGDARGHARRERHDRPALPRPPRARERDGRRRRQRRLDEQLPAPAGDRARGGRPAVARRARGDQRGARPSSPTSSPAGAGWPRTCTARAGRRP